MNLSPKAQQSYEFTEELFRQRLISAKEFLKAVRSIYQDDATYQVSELVEKGFSGIGALRHIYNLDKGEDIL